MSAAATDALYLDRDGELVQVVPPSAWLPERWGPATPGLAVCRVLASAPRYEATGEIVQRDLRGCLLVRDAAGRVPAALRALAGAQAHRRYSSGDAECSHCRDALANGPDGLCAGCRVGLAISGVERFLTVTPDAQPSEPRAAALHACLVCGRHPATHTAASEDERCQACGLGDERPLIPASARWAADVAPDATDEGGS